MEELIRLAPTIADRMHLRVGHGLEAVGLVLTDDAELALLDHVLGNHPALDPHVEVIMAMIRSRNGLECLREAVALAKRSPLEMSV